MLIILTLVSVVKGPLFVKYHGSNLFYYIHFEFKLLLYDSIGATFVENLSFNEIMFFQDFDQLCKLFVLLIFINFQP